MHDFLSANIHNMHRIKRRGHCETFSGHILFMSRYTGLSPQTGVVLLLLNTLTDSTLLCVVGCVMKKNKKKKTSIFLNLEKSYIHIDNNVKFIMYKSSKSLQSEKVIVFALHTLAKKNRNQHL